MDSPITVSAEIQSGEPVLSGTRVPVKNLFDYLKGGKNVDEFLEDFPSVRYEQALNVVELAGK